jgi:hypothetical protein
MNFSHSSRLKKILPVEHFIGEKKRWFFSKLREYTKFCHFSEIGRHDVCHVLGTDFNLTGNHNGWHRVVKIQTAIL